MIVHIYIYIDIMLWVKTSKVMVIFIRHTIRISMYIIYPHVVLQALDSR